MSRPFSSDEAALRRFVSDLQTKTTLAPRTVAFYKESVHAVVAYMKKNDLPTLPHQVKPEHVKILLDCMARDNLAIATRKGYLSALKKFLNHFGNEAIVHLDFSFPHDSRPKVDWLTTEEVHRLLECPKTVTQDLVIHCELCLGLRRVEVVRLGVHDLHDSQGYLVVRGKGSQGGKPRSVPYNKETLSILQRVRARRDEQIRKALESYPQVIPDNLLLWYKSGRVHAYSEEGYGIDKVVSEPLSRQLGFRFSNHTLRRTFGRAMYRADVPVATIAKILGHESTEVTLRYIGVDLDDMRKAMAVEIY